uniref:Uncharacterized protein n=1 Tax=Setaria digitata TaxID=48799 RepID=A0A915PTE9_9BILA
MMRKYERTSDSRQNLNLSLDATHHLKPIWSESSLLFGGRKARYLPLAVNGIRRMRDENTYRIVMLGDYSSGISMLRCELAQLNSIRDIPFSDAACCTIITEDGYELQLWLFVDLQSFELFYKECTEEIDCCIACYSIAIVQTYRSVIEKWIPEFVKKFPEKPIILCALNDCTECISDSGNHEMIIFEHDFNFYDTNIVQIDVAIFDKKCLQRLCTGNNDCNLTPRQIHDLGNLAVAFSGVFP